MAQAQKICEDADDVPNPLLDLLTREGETTRIATELQISTQAISQWKRKGVVPPSRVLDVERVTGVHRHFLNPGIYPERPG